MTSIRRALSVVAALSLCCHAATMTLAAATVGMLPFGDTALLCTCAHPAGDGGICPMHHTAVRTPQSHASQASDASHAAHGARHSSPEPGRPTCYMRSADHGSGAVLVSVFGPLGLPASAVIFTAPAVVTPHATLSRGDAIDRMLAPEPPPPRA